MYLMHSIYTTQHRAPSTFIQVCMAIYQISLAVFLCSWQLIAFSQPNNKKAIIGKSIYTNIATQKVLLVQFYGCITCFTVNNIHFEFHRFVCTMYIVSKAYFEHPTIIMKIIPLSISRTWVVGSRQSHSFFMRMRRKKGDTCLCFRQYCAIQTAVNCRSGSGEFFGFNWILVRRVHFWLIFGPDIFIVTATTVLFFTAYAFTRTHNKQQILAAYWIDKLFFHRSIKSQSKRIIKFSSNFLFIPSSFSFSLMWIEKDTEKMYFNVESKAISTYRGWNETSLGIKWEQEK